MPPAMTRCALALGCLLVLAPASGLAQAPAPPLTLERAVERFLARNLTVEAARYRVDMARAERLAATLRHNPTLTVSGEQLKLSGPTPAGELYEVTSSLSYPIELADKRRLRTEAADASVLLAEAQLADVLRQRLTDLKRAFYDVLLARAARDHALDTRRTFDTLVDFNRVRLEEGAVAEGDLLKVRLERSKHDTAVSQAELALRQAGIRLLDLLGESDFSTAGTVVGALDVRAEVPHVEALKAEALRERPSVLAAQHSVTVATRRVSLEQARATVDVSPFVGYRRVGENNTVLFGISIPLPIHDRNQGAIARAIAEEKTAQAELTLHRTRVLAEVESAWHAWQTARSQAGAFERELLRQADESHAIALQAYQEGALGLVEYLEAQRTLATLRHEYARTLFDAHTALVSLEHAVGRDLGR
jgi:cobalt-zinc-cadmium efflux system outer membrane protein